MTYKYNFNKKCKEFINDVCKLKKTKNYTDAEISIGFIYIEAERAKKYYLEKQIEISNFKSILYECFEAALKGKLIIEDDEVS